MNARLRQTAGANYATRERIRDSAAKGGSATTLDAAAASFGASYRLRAESAGVGAAFRDAGDDLGRRFARIGEAASASQRETAAELSALTETRNALYPSIVERIVRKAQLVARRRGLSKVEYGDARSRGSVDLTNLVRTALITGE